MRSGVVVALKSLIVFLLVMVVGAMAGFFPWMAVEMSRDAPEFASLRVPLLVLVEIALACALAFLVCLWALLTRVRAGRIFDVASFTWVAAMGIASGIAALVCVVAGFVIPGPPLLVLSVLLCALLCAGLGMVLVVMRGLLVQASSFRAELNEVI